MDSYFTTLAFLRFSNSGPQAASLATPSRWNLLRIATGRLNWSSLFHGSLRSYGSSRFHAFGIDTPRRMNWLHTTGCRGNRQILRSPLDMFNIIENIIIGTLLKNVEAPFFRRFSMPHTYINPINHIYSVPNSTRIIRDSVGMNHEWRNQESLERQIKIG